MIPGGGNYIYLPKKIILTLGLVLICGFVSGQVNKRHEMELALLVKIPEHVIWPAETPMDTFKLVLLTDDQNLINDFGVFAQKRKIKGKPVKLSVQTAFSPAMYKAHMIFIAANKLKYYLELFDAIEGQPILLVSDTYQDPKLVMVNLFDTPEKTLTFEINRANIINQNLGIGDEILLIGGSSIDVADLYRKAQQSLRSMEKKLNQNTVLFDSLMGQITLVETTISQKNDTITAHEIEIKKDRKQLREHQEKIQHQLEVMEDQELVLSSYENSIKSQKRELEKVQQKSDKQRKQIMGESEKLSRLLSHLDTLNREIEKSKYILGQQSTTISRQRQILVLFIVVILLSALLVFIVFMTLKNNRKKHEVLNSKNMEIEEMNFELQASNEELNEKNEELYVILDQLETAQSHLLQSEKMASIGVLTAGIAHELNNPLNFIYGGVHVLIRDLEDIIPIMNKVKTLRLEDSDNREIVGSIQQLIEEKDFYAALDAIQQTVHDIKLGSDRAISIVKGMRNFSRVENEHFNIFDVHESLDDALILLQNKIKNRIQIIKKYTPENPQINCIPGKINQAFMNIINNAIDAIPEKGTIEIETKMMREQVTIIIKDSGIGMNAEQKSKLFDPFFTTKEVGKGIGLGLSITYKAIADHRGTIEVISEPNQGATFLIMLPINPPLITEGL